MVPAGNGVYGRAWQQCPRTGVTVALAPATSNAVRYAGSHSFNGFFCSHTHARPIQPWRHDVTRPHSHGTWDGHGAYGNHRSQAILLSEWGQSPATKCHGGTGARCGMMRHDGARGQQRSVIEDCPLSVEAMRQGHELHRLRFVGIEDGRSKA